MRFSKLPSNPTLTTLMIFVPLKNHTPWFVLGLAKAILSVRTGKVCNDFRYEGSQWQMAEPTDAAWAPLACPGLQLFHISNCCGSHKGVI